MAALLAVAGLRAAEAAPVLTSAQAAITFAAPTVCEVALTVTVAEAAAVEHRLELLAGAGVALLDVDGARPAGDPREVGRTLALQVAPSVPGGAYTIRYRVTQASERAYRCPLWLPTTPADGRSRRVQLVVTVPDGAEASATMPAFAWTGPRGTATLPHLPAIVIVPFARVGEPRPWDISRAMDLTALATLAGSTALWLRRQRGRR